MEKYGCEKHGELGECVSLRFTPEFVKKQTGKDADYGFYTAEEFSEKFNCSSSVPVEIAQDVEGEYEAVCEYGIEIH